MTLAHLPQLRRLAAEWLDSKQSSSGQRLIGWSRSGVRQPYRPLTEAETHLIGLDKNMPIAQAFLAATRGNVAFHAADADPSTAAWRSGNPLRTNAPASLLYAQKARGSLFSCTFEQDSEEKGGTTSVHKRYFGQVFRFVRLQFAGATYQIAQVRLWHASAVVPVPHTHNQVHRLTDSSKVYAPPTDVFIHLPAIDSQVIAGDVSTEAGGSCVLAML